MPRTNIDENSPLAGPRSFPTRHEFLLALTIVLLVLLLLILRYGPLRGYTASAGSFSGGFAYRYNQLQEVGHDLNGSNPVYSSFDSGVNPVRGEIFFVKLQLMIDQVTGNNRYTGSLFSASLVESTMLTAAFLSIGWMWAGKLERLRPDRWSGWLRGYVTIAFVAGSPTIILYLLGWNAAYGWLFILGVVYLWHKHTAVTKNRALVILLSLVLFG